MNEQQIRTALKSWLTGVFAQLQNMVFDRPLVAGNVIAGNLLINSAPYPISIPFTTSNQNTLELFANAIQTIGISGDGVTYAVALDSNTIQVKANGVNQIGLSSFAVTGGSTQAVIAIDSLINPVPILYDYQALPATGPFVAYKIGSVVSKSYDSKLGFNRANLFQSGGIRQATITISYFGYSPENGIANNYAPQSASMISDSLELSSVQTTFNAQGLAYLHKNPVQQLTYLLESKYQPRADFDFYLGFVAKEVDKLSWIERVTVTGEIEDAAGNVIDEIVENIPN